jgi:prolyl-tRNA editing enzyme YbaK/EbsC (Cys-tRNA(Pro) deacylase)
LFEYLILIPAKVTEGRHRANSILREIDAEFETMSHEPVHSIEQAAEVRGVDRRQIVKSVLMETQSDRTVHACVPGNREVSPTVFEDHALLPPEQVEKITGFEPGKVHPLSSGLPHVVESRLFDREELCFTTGDRDKAVKMDVDDLRCALKSMEFSVEVREVVEPSDSEKQELLDSCLDEDSARFVMNSGNLHKFRRISGYGPNLAVTALIEMDRHTLDLGKEEISRVLERAESDNHLQKLLESYSRSGELPQESQHNVDEVVQSVMEDNQDAVQDLHDGKESALNYLIGQVMQETKGSADASKVENLISSEL